MVKSLLKIFIILFFAVVDLSAQSISVLASIDSSDYLVGDYITYTLEVRANKNLIVTTPNIRDSLKNIEVIKELETLSGETENTKSRTYAFIISYYDSGSVTISPIPVKYKVTGTNEEKIALSNPVTFNVHTVEVQPKADIKDVKEPLTIPLDWVIIFLITLIVLIFLDATYDFYQTYKNKKAEQPMKKKIIRIPAHVRALKALDELEIEKLWQKGMVKEYHSEITGIIRNYFEKRFNLPALELTTSEQMQQLNKVSEAENILTITNEFLNNADMVKFAKFKPLPSVNETMMKQAKEIVTNTMKNEPTQVEEEVESV